MLPGALFAITAAVAVAAFLLLRGDPPATVEATYDGSELTLELPDGASITVPAGAARPGSRVRARVATPSEAPDLPPYARGVQALWDFEVEGGLLAPVTIRLPLPPQESWVLASYRDDQWVPVGFEIVGGQVVAVVDHLTLQVFLQHACAIAALLIFDTHCLGMLIDGAAELLDSYESIFETDECENRDYSVFVGNNTSYGLIHGCAIESTVLVGDDIPDKRTLLVVQNLRKFVLDMHVTDGSANLTQTLPLPSCCDNGVNVLGGESSFWFSDPVEVTITAELSLESIITQVAYFALMFVPGVDSVRQVPPELVVTMHHLMIEAVEMKQAQASFTSGDRSDGFEHLAQVLRDPAFMTTIAGQLKDRVEEKPNMLFQLGSSLPLEIFDEVFKIIDVVEVAIVLRDIEKALIETDRLEGAVRFARVAVTPATPTATPVSAVTAAGAVAEREREALAALYHATGGPNWTYSHKWLTEAPLGEWWGVTTNEKGGVTRLFLTANQLTRAIPAELGNLTSLEELTLFDNRLSGPIPAELGNLTSLSTLNLGSNQLSGPIPAWLGDSTSLTVLSLSANELTGPIPAELGNLTSLRTLNLAGSQVSGPIPAWLADFTSLTTLSLHHNQLSGPIPAWLGNLSSLTVLSLSANELSGPIPAELGNLKSLKELWLSINQLSGPIPAWLGDLTSLRTLVLDGNELSGPIPAELGNLTSLTELGLTANQLTGAIPAELGNLTSLERLALFDNRLSGPIPAWLGNLTSPQDLGPR